MSSPRVCIVTIWSPLRTFRIFTLPPIPFLCAEGVPTNVVVPTLLIVISTVLLPILIVSPVFIIFDISDTTVKVVAAEQSKANDVPEPNALKVRLPATL